MLQFQNRVTAALKDVQKILDTTRHPVYPTEGSHTYNDKYTLAELATSATVASVMDSFSSIWPNFRTEVLSMKKQAEAENKTVTLQIESEEQCSFVETVTKKVDSATTVTKTSSSLLGNSKHSSKVVTTVIQHKWKYDFKFKVCIYTGNDAGNGVIVYSSDAGQIFTTVGQVDVKPQQPLPARGLGPFSVDLTWFLKQIDCNSTVSFAINRELNTCHTPSRNEDIAEAQLALKDMANFVFSVGQHLRKVIRESSTRENRTLATDLQILGKDIFSPVLVLFSLENQDDGSSQFTCLSKDFEAFQQNHISRLKEHIGIEQARHQGVDADTGSINLMDTCLNLMIMEHVSCIADQHFSQAIEAIEIMLRNQLIAAIGKHIGPHDFSEYMLYHNNKIFKPEFRPRAFSYSIQRDDAVPEGTLSIESDADKNAIAPIYTISAKRAAETAMMFPLSAAANVSFMGSRCVHACALTSFSGQSPPSLRMAARARQFSSFILMVGNIAGPTLFQPSDAIIVRNKDEIIIPLLLETLPTAKEFKEAIESLSPEMRRFAKAFRSMQLASTLFGVCILQIKPQMEKVLNLPNGSLTKHIKLTQTLMEMFITYQIPTDLMTYDGPADLPVDEKVEAVKGHVDKLTKLIEFEKEEEIRIAVERAAKARLEAERAAQARQEAEEAERRQRLEVGRKSLSKTKKKKGGGGMRKMFQRSVNEDACLMKCADVDDMLEVECAADLLCEEEVGGMCDDDDDECDDFGDDCDSMNSSEDESDGGGSMDESDNENDTSNSDDGKQVKRDKKMQKTVTDYTLLPALLDKRFEQFDEDSAMRPTTIKTKEIWSRTSQNGLLSQRIQTSVDRNTQRNEKQKAMDLIDALTRSGVMVYDQADLHVVLAATHCFDKTLIDTVIVDNKNPIEKVERSTLIMASTIHNRPSNEMIESSELERVAQFSPKLFLES
eukprot:m.12678 g.12678  ORF g.12678 m.12678 type:complete len:946 (+) comp4710_c0_seq1:102-2939(+)